MYKSDSDSMTGMFRSSDKIDSNTHEGNIPDLQAVQDVLGGGGSNNGKHLTPHTHTHTYVHTDT